MKLSHKIAGGLLAASLMTGTAFSSVIDRPFFQVTGLVVVWGATDTNANSGVAPVVSDFVLLTGASGTAGADLISDDVYTVVTGSLTPIEGDEQSNDATTYDPVTGEATSPAGFGDDAYSDDNGNGVLDAGDSMSAFAIDGSTDVDGLVGAHNSSFYVASNAAFDIYAQSTAAVTTGDFSALDESNISFSLAVTTSGDDGLAFGGNAQDPTGAANGTATATTIDSLDDIVGTDTVVFEGGQRTAASRGSLAAQSVRFDATYELDADTATAGVQGYDLSLGAGSITSDVTYTVYVP